MFIQYTSSQMAWLTPELQNLFCELVKEHDEIKKAALYEQVDKIFRKKRKINENNNTN